MLFKSKKGELGFETLMIVIAMIMIAALAAGLLMVQASKYQSSGHALYKDARDHSAVAIQVPSIIGEDGSDQDIEILHMMFKLMPGSVEIPMNQLVITMNLYDSKIILENRHTNPEHELSNQGFNTWTTEEKGVMQNCENDFDVGTWIISDATERDLLVDIDGDGLNDSVIGCGPNPGGAYQCNTSNHGTHLAFYLTDSNEWFETPLLNLNGSIANISNAQSAPVTLDINYTPINFGAGGFFTLQGVANSNDYTIGWDGEYMKLFTPSKLNEDLDDDWLDDYIGVRSDVVVVLLSSAKPYEIPLGDNITDAPAQINLNKKIRYGKNEYGTLSINADVTQADVIPENATFLITPKELHYGYFTLEYVKKSERWKPTNLVPGDIVVLHFETPRGLIYNDEVSIQILDGMSASIPVSFAIKNTMKNETRVQLFPTI